MRHQFKLELAAITLALLLGKILPVGAAEIPASQFNVSGWSGSAYNSDSDGSFSHCAMSATYNSGITLLFSIGSDFWRMGLYNSNWNLVEGQAYPIIYWVDNTPPQQVSAVAVATQGVSILLPLTAVEFNLFRYGNQVTIVAASQTFQFNLTGTSSSLFALGACAVNHTTLASSNPFAAPNPFVTPPQTNMNGGDMAAERARLQAEATTVAANILGNAGIAFSFIPPDKIPPTLKSYLAVWATPNALGDLSP